MSVKSNAPGSIEFLEYGIFTVGEACFTLGHVLGAVDHYGDAAEVFWNRLGDSLACERYADEEGFVIDEERLQAALDDFRYRFDLVSAEQTERWLRERRLTEDALAGSLARVLWAERFREELPEIRRYFHPGREELTGALWSEIVVHGHLADFSRVLAERVVARFLLPREREESLPDIRPAAVPLRGLGVIGERSGGSSSFGCPDWARCTDDWRNQLREMDTHYEAVLGEILSPRMLESALMSRRLDLIRFTLKIATGASLNGAREALLCITEDGEDFDRAAERASALLQERELFLDQVPDSAAPHLVSAVPGETFLVEDGDRPILVRVVERIPATVDDPAVLRRLETILLNRAFAPAIRENLRWIVPPEGHHDR